MAAWRRRGGGGRGGLARGLAGTPPAALIGQFGAGLMELPDAFPKLLRIDAVLTEMPAFKAAHPDAVNPGA